MTWVKEEDVEERDRKGGESVGIEKGRVKEGVK